MAIDHAAGIEFGSTSGNLVAQAVQPGFAHPVLVFQQPHAFTHRLTGGLIAPGSTQADRKLACSGVKDTLIFSLLATALLRQWMPVL